MNFTSSFLHHLTFKEFVVQDVCKKFGQYRAKEGKGNEGKKQTINKEGVCDIPLKKVTEELAKGVCSVIVLNSQNGQS